MRRRRGKDPLFARMLLLVTSTAALQGCATSGGDSPKAGAGPATPPPAAAMAPKPQRAAADIRMESILDNPKALAVLRKHAPAIADHPQIGMSRGMTLAQVAGYPEAGLTPELLNAIVSDLNAL
jgi:hypothetical protein